MHVPEAGMQSAGLRIQFALMTESLRPDTPALTPSFVNVPLPPHADSIVSPKAASTPPLSAAPGPTQLTPNVTPSRPRAVPSPPSATSSPGRNTTQCSSPTRTKAGKQCSRQVKIPATHSHLNPTPVLYCHQHKKAIIAQHGFYVRKAGNADRFVGFSLMPTLEVKKGDGRLISFHFTDYIPEYLQVDTQAALRVEMEKATSLADAEGYIYTLEIRGNVVSRSSAPRPCAHR
jgi:hypothetical protein